MPMTERLKLRLERGLGDPQPEGSKSVAEQLSVSRKTTSIPGKSPKYAAKVEKGIIIPSDIIPVMNALQMGYGVEFDNPVYLTIAIG